MADPRAALIAQMARARGLDPAAVLSIASVEGGFNGAVGDNGTSFGPFQLHEGGALPSGIANPAQWANSPQGISYAENAIQKVAQGLKGKAAIAAISSKFERPADVHGEIAKASDRYGQFSAGGKLPTGPGPIKGPVPPGYPMPPWTGQYPPGTIQNASPAPALQLAMQLVSNGGSSPLLQLAQQRLQLAAAHSTFGPQSSANSSVIPTKALPGGPSVDKGFQLPFVGATTQGEDPGFLVHLTTAAKAAGATQIRVTSGRRSEAHNASVGGVQDSNHLTGHALDGEAYVPGRGWVPLGTLLKGVAPKFGLRSGDQPGFFNGGPDPVHVDDGFNVKGSM